VCVYVRVCARKRETEKHAREEGRERERERKGESVCERERERERETESRVAAMQPMSFGRRAMTPPCVCVCARERRQREIKREQKREQERKKERERIKTRTFVILPYDDNAIVLERQGEGGGRELPRRLCLSPSFSLALSHSPLFFLTRSICTYNMPWISWQRVL